MASIGFLIGGALVNALAFTGSNYLFSSLSKESIEKERKRHDKAIEDMQQAQLLWAKKDNNVSITLIMKLRKNIRLKKGLRTLAQPCNNIS